MSKSLTIRERNAITEVPIPISTPETPTLEQFEAALCAYEHNQRYYLQLNVPHSELLERLRVLELWFLNIIEPLESQERADWKKQEVDKYVNGYSPYCTEDAKVILEGSIKFDAGYIRRKKTRMSRLKRLVPAFVQKTSGQPECKSEPLTDPEQLTSAVEVNSVPTMEEPEPEPEEVEPEPEEVEPEPEEVEPEPEEVEPEPEEVEPEPEEVEPEPEPKKPKYIQSAEPKKPKYIQSAEPKKVKVKKPRRPKYVQQAV